MIQNTCSSLLVSVVKRGRGDRVVELARGAGAAGSTVLLGRGTARNRVLQLLCLADTAKEVIFTIAPDIKMAAIIEALRSAPDLCKRTPGVGFTIPVDSFIHAGSSSSIESEGCLMKENISHQLICAIVNYGLVDDIMAAARNAGARGGTVFRARGTASSADSSFFGITVVPEKEMLMVLAANAEADAIAAAIRSCPCLEEPGAGIIFRLPATDFFPLGLKANTPSEQS